MAAAGAMLFAGGLKAAGQIEANKSEAAAHRINAAFMREQSKQALRKSKLEQNAFDIESRQFLGSKISAFAKSGVTMSGSALLKIAESKANISNEFNQIVANGKANAEAYLFKAKQMEDEASRVSNMSLLQVLATGTETASNVMTSYSMNKESANG